MTDELLTQANNLKDRIRTIDKLLEQLDLSDVSMVNPMARTSPIAIQAGMAQTIQFELLPADIDSSETTEIQRLDAEVYKLFVRTLKDYRNKVQDMFDKLA